ncbi:MAG: nickel-responsive transcriptional regulator NikR [Candidatus Aminicenantes bacterium]|nr:nickel-responsive transcriptional regulator NikR [Candidatus Aminicenantes bacterium]
MGQLVRVSISLDADLLRDLDGLMKKSGHRNRSEAVRDLIRDRLVGEEWKDEDREAVAVLALIYNHEAREIGDILNRVQHEHFRTIVSATHVHLDRHNCLETIILKGRIRLIRKTAGELLGLRKVKHGKLIMTTTGRNLI